MTSLDFGEPLARAEAHLGLARLHVSLLIEGESLGHEPVSASSSGGLLAFDSCECRVVQASTASCTVWLDRYWPVGALVRVAALQAPTRVGVATVAAVAPQADHRFLTRLEFSDQEISREALTSWEINQ